MEDIISKPLELQPRAGRLPPEAKRTRKLAHTTEPPARITVVTTVDPPNIGKVVRPDGAGGYAKQLVMDYSIASYRTLEEISLSALAKQIESCRPGLDYLLAGVAGGDGEICGYAGGPGIQKTNDIFPFPSGPGLLLIDMDDDFAMDPTDLAWAFGEAGLWDMAMTGFVWYVPKTSRRRCARRGRIHTRRPAGSFG